MNEYVLSIIIPVYNRAELVNSCVTDILEQSVEVEIVLVDDFSTDNTAKVCADFSSKYQNIVFVKMTQNKGPGAARNEGIKVAGGKFLFFLDSDDRIVNIVSLMKLLNDNPDVDVVCSNMISVRADGTTYESTHVFNEEQQMEMDEWFNKNSATSIHSHLYRTTRREFIQENNILYPELYCAEDGIFTLDVLMNARSIYVTPLLVYRYYQQMPNSLVELSRADGNKELSFTAMTQMINHLVRLVEKERIAIRRVFLERVLDNTVMVAISFSSAEALKNNSTIVGKHFKSITSKISSLCTDKDVYLCPGSVFNLDLAYIFNSIGNVPINGFIDNMSKANACGRRLLDNGFKLYKPELIAGKNGVVILFSPSPVIIKALITQFSNLGFSAEYHKGVYYLIEKEMTYE